MLQGNPKREFGLRRQESAEVIVSPAVTDEKDRT